MSGLIHDFGVVLTAERQEAEALKRSARKVLEGFDSGVFVRNVDGDGQSGWAMKLLPYIQALQQLAALSAPPGDQEAK